MKDYKILFHIAILLILLVLASLSCTFTIVDPETIHTPEASTTAPATKKIALKSFHGRYVTAMGEDDDWALRQETELSNCGWFTQHYLANGKIALETCHNRYIIAPRTGAERLDWMLGQESELSDCGQFDLYELGSGKVALKTCAGSFFTAGDGNWPAPLQWLIVAETDVLQDWEIFTVLQQ